jgi:hypothetical protein
MRCLLALLLVAAPAWPDEIQTKDGKKVEFKTLVDEGDYWDLTTSQGTKVTVKKADFDKFIPSGVKESPLTGAAFTFDKKRKLTTVDLLSKFDPKNILDGSWKLASGALVGARTTSGNAKLELKYTPPEEYDLTMVAERKETTGAAPGFVVGLVGGGRQFGFFFDRATGLNGPIDVAGETLETPGRVFDKGKPRTLTFMIRKEALIVMIDGKDYMGWKADWSKVSMNAFFGVASKNTLFLTLESATFSISKLVVTTPKE